MHNVSRPWERSYHQASQYPPTMLLTADHDDRVVPLHTLKLLAVGVFNKLHYMSQYIFLLCLQVQIWVVPCALLTQDFCIHISDHAVCPRHEYICKPTK